MLFHAPHSAPAPPPHTLSAAATSVDARRTVSMMSRLAFSARPAVSTHSVAVRPSDSHCSATRAPVLASMSHAAWGGGGQSVGAVTLNWAAVSAGAAREAPQRAAAEGAAGRGGGHRWATLIACLHRRAAPRRGHPMAGGRRSPVLPGAAAQPPAGRRTCDTCRMHGSPGGGTYWDLSPGLTTHAQNVIAAGGAGRGARAARQLPRNAQASKN